MSLEPPRPFDAFPHGLPGFLANLAAHNDRAWFEAHRDDYAALYKAPAEAFCVEMAPRLAALSGGSVKPKVFRIFRDVRFSKDKTPYNPWLRVSFTPADAPAGPAWMVGLDAESLTIGVGAFALPAARLAAFREAVISEAGAEIVLRLEALAADGVRLSEPELKRVPAGYDREHPRAALLRHKGLTGWIDLDPALATTPGLPDSLMAGFRRLQPLFDLLR